MIFFCLFNCQNFAQSKIVLFVFILHRIDFRLSRFKVTVHGYYLKQKTYFEGENAKYSFRRPKIKM